MGGLPAPPYPPGPFHVAVRRRAKAELAIQAVCVRGVQHPAESRARAVLDHHRDDGLAQAPAAVRGQHVHVGQVGRPTVADRAGQADHRAGRIVGPDEPPGPGDLAAYVRFGAPPAPVGLRGQERRGGRGIDPGRVVVELVVPDGMSRHSTSRAWSMSVIRSAAGSTPTDSRIRPAGAVSAGQRARRSQVDSTPPKLVAGRISRELATTLSAASALSGLTSNDSNGPKPSGICRLASSDIALSTPGPSRPG